MRLRRAIIPLIFVLIAAFQQPIFAALPLAAWGDAGWAIFFFLYGVAAPILVMSLFPGGFSRIIDELGLDKKPIPALLFGFFATAPVLLGFAAKAQINPALTVSEILMGGLFFPFVEETFFRGFLFGQLYARAGWGFWPAALAPAVVFALGHLYQSRDPAELAGILAVTGVGSIVFSYIFVQWGGNIWAPFAGHALLNIWWSVFDVDDTALGDQFANALRLSAIVLAVGFCFLAPRFGWLQPLKRGEAAAPGVGTG